MIILSEILASHSAWGVYVLKGSLALDDLERLAKQHDLAFFTLQGRHARDKQEFLEHTAAALGFPDYFGKNWDSFADCLTDMSWIERDGFMIVYADCQQFADHAADEFDTAVEIFKEAAEFWRKEGKGFLVLLHDATGREWALPPISL